MSSAHYIIVARNTRTGKIELPLGDDLTLYGVDPEAEESLLRETVCAQYTEEWSIALYQPMGGFYSGKRAVPPYDLELKTTRGVDGRRLHRVGITFNGKWCGYFKSFNAAVTCLTIRKIPPDQARRDIAPFFPNRRARNNV